MSGFLGRTGSPARRRSSGGHRSAYAPLLVLTLGGLAFLHLTPWVAYAVVALMAVVVLSYRQVVHAYPSGGGTYEVVATNLGPSAGLVVAASQGRPGGRSSP